MYRTLSGKEPAEAVLSDIKARVARLGRSPKLVIVQVAEDPASTSYVNSKVKKAGAVGINAEARRLPGTITEKELLSVVKQLNEDRSVDGFIVQLPLPKHIDADKIVDSIDPRKDVDGFTSPNMGRLFLDMPVQLLPATPSGIMRMLDFYKVQVEGKHAVVVGRSNIVGRPVALMLLNRNATVTVCHSKTKDLAKHTATADILIVAVGKPNLVKADMVKEGCCVIDVGTTKVVGKMTGDVEFEAVIKKADCTPVPGGVGLMTVAMLLDNLVKACEKG